MGLRCTIDERRLHNVTWLWRCSLSHPLGHVTPRDGLGKSMSDIELIVGGERIRETSRYSLDDLADYSVKLLDQYHGTGQR